MRKRVVSQLWVSTNAEPLTESARVASLMRDVEIKQPQRGLSVQVGPYTLKVLWPASGTHVFESVPGEGSAVNNSSIALLITSHDLSLFAAGDIEPPVQHELIGDISKVDIYKVAHHGSRHQDPAFMSALTPQVAIISVGTKNSYGHPAPQTVEALTRLGTEVVRTDINGAISITAKAHVIKVRTSTGRFNLFRLG